MDTDSSGSIFRSSKTKGQLMYEIWLISGSFLLGVGFGIGMLKILSKTPTLEGKRDRLGAKKAT